MVDPAVVVVVVTAGRAPEVVDVEDVPPDDELPQAATSSGTLSRTILIPRVSRRLALRTSTGFTDCASGADSNVPLLPGAVRPVGVSLRRYMRSSLNYPMCKHE